MMKSGAVVMCLARGVTCVFVHSIHTVFAACLGVPWQLPQVTDAVCYRVTLLLFETALFY